MRDSATRPGLPAVRIPTATVLRLLASLALALLLWSWVTTQQDPTIPATFPDVPLQEPELSDPRLTVGPFGDITVRVVVEGPRSLVRELGPDDLDPRLDLGGVDGPGDYTVPIQVTTPNGVRVEQLEPPQLSIIVDETASRSFHLVPEPIVPDDNTRRLGEVTPAVSEVTVSGPRRLVDAVARVVLPVEIGEQTSDFTGQFTPVAQNEAGEPVTEVRIRPQRVEATVRVEARGRSVPVLIQTIGDPAQGYEVGDRVANPDMVVLDGPDDAINDIVSVSTAPVMIDGATEPISQTVGLEGLPAGVQVVDPPDGNVVVVVQVRPRGTTQTVTAQGVEVTDLSPGLVASVDPAAVDVEIFAAEDTLAGLRADEIVPRVSAAGLGPGTYQLPLEVSVPAGVQWLRTDPMTATVTVRPRDGTPVTSAAPEPGLGSV